MTSRRPHGQSYADPAPAPASPSAPADSDVTPAVPAPVIYKLLAFTAAMVFGPIGMYFLTVESIFKGNPIFSGITAAVTANVVLFAYIYVAWKEDQGDRLEEEAKRKGKKAE
ncbi:vacuolar ATPase assembly integral membrane protein vma21 [Monascus purpureus]|uniref:Vacuolar ATPase assembly integral membrane protein vma21 n=1 Tax=Monascus purpureus TaxID=5098 RepID=A0A507R1I2_MONPU|nr:vacuolar ATPase assembly integral membrane protein vma21 [Monascus purpureus]BDD63582.1 vacuolar ATPase assembly integral membrane protein vma21 [Monascus purpureus]